MYDAKGKLIKVNEIAFQTNPKDSGNQNYGMQMTTIKDGLVGEDAVMFNQPLAYSIKTNQRSVLLRTTAEHVQRWPIDIKNQSKMLFMEKYRIFFTQVQTVQEKLNKLENKHILNMETKMQKRV